MKICFKKDLTGMAIGLLMLAAGTLTGSAQIVMNQIGFYPQGKKVAVVINGALNRDFRLLNASSRQVVYEGKLSEAVQSTNSSLVTRIADFSSFITPGSYIIASGMFETPPFKIERNVLRGAAIASLKGFYYQRVSMPLEEKYAGKWARPAGHPDDAVLVHPSAATKRRPAGTIISAPGGWYDAGDYNKYIVNSGITMGTLLSAYEDFPQYYERLDIAIPETGNGAPDLLNEAAYNLRWMLAMQDPGDGGVYNKLTNAAFDAMTARPGETKEPRYVVQKGTAAALDFAAVTAQAARIYEAYPQLYSGLADSCLKASKRAWNWAMKFPDMPYDQGAMNRTHKPEISTGGYGDRSFGDEWFWAAAELYLTTGEAKYAKAVTANIIKSPQLPSWGNVYMLGLYSLIRKQSPAFANLLKPTLLTMADELAEAVATSAFGLTMGRSRNDFIWGSSSVAANQGILLINAYLQTRDAKYLNAAAGNADYLLGRNATGYCFLTGFGYRPVLNIHHRPSASDSIADPVPGLLSGGPNFTAQRSDRQYYEFTEPETTFADVVGSYASNEIAINWNAPAVYLFNAVEACR
ncbi:MAG: glycoside hydrolase family 9 protein [Tannerellaceae bacterium]|jgi:endoglucanase|nr:glycoside hydrolase family 9 protein [Tannerellaceae bacterium]